MERRDFLSLTALPLTLLAAPLKSKTEIAIERHAFLINGKLTYAGRMYQGRKIGGLLLNTRMVQGIFDDRNPETRRKWAYPDTG